MGIDLEMQRAAIFDVAGSLLAAHSNFRSPNQLPLGALVVGDVSSHILLNLGSRDRFLDVEDLLLSLLLLLVHVSSSHA